MVKHTFLVSPFGEVNLRAQPSYLHIQASEQMAGDWALGWWHAQRAGDEAVLARRFWRAEMSSHGKPLAGSTEVDAFVAQWDFTADLDLETAALPAIHRSRVGAYVQGFNHGRRRKGREAAWSSDDCHLLARTLGFLEWWETRLPQMRFLLEAWRAGLAWERLLDLWPGLGPEPDRRDWDGVELPLPFSPEARSLIDRLRRFRPYPATMLPANRSADGRPLLAAGYISDVTEPGLPFLPVRIDTGLGSVRGLSRPGHPGFLTGRTGWLAWSASVVVDDTIDLRVIDQGPGRAVHARWAASGQGGTLAGLLALEEAPNVEMARARTQGLGTAALDFWAVDPSGGTGHWAQGPRWRRLSPRDAWLPALGSNPPTVRARTPFDAPEASPGRGTTGDLVAKFTTERNPSVEAFLAPLRFLLPETEEGLRLRRWTGASDCPEAALFERLYGCVQAAFWEGSPLAPAADSPVARALDPAVDALLQATHSAWLPSASKNPRLAAAVRQAFSAGPPGPPVLSRRATRPCWKEAHGGKPRVFALTTAVVIHPGERGWLVFHTDDETEAPVFEAW